MKKKLLFVINTLGRAGAEVAMLELMRQFPPGQYAIDLYVVLGQGELKGQLPEAVRLLNKRYKEVSVLSKEGRREIKKTLVRSFFHNGGVMGKLCYIGRNLFDMVRRGRISPDKLMWRMLSDGGEYPADTYDLAIAYLEGASTYFVADHVKAEKKAAFVHIDYRSAGYTRKLDASCYEKYDRIFGVSDEVREHFLAVYPEHADKTMVFHNIIDAERVRGRADEPGGFADGYDGFRLLTVGRLTRQKGYDIAVDAMKLLKEKGLSVRWYVLGEGDQREALEKKIRQYGLDRDFILMGAVENPYPYYRQCDLYVHATRFEGKSIAIQEAQILGCAILASDCNGNREQIVSGTDGILCELAPDVVAREIEALMRDGEKRERLKSAAEKKVAGCGEEMALLLALLD